MNQQVKLTERTADKLKDTAAILPNISPETPTPPTNSAVKPNEGSPHVAPAKALKVALIGTAPSSRLLAPFNDPDWEIWACSPGNMQGLPRVNLWFEIHSNLLWPECRSYGEPYIQWLNQQSFPIYMQDQKLVPRAMSYPIKEMTDKYGKYFFTSSFAYMIAMAIEKGASEIALYGIDMASKDEYILQRPGGHYFMQEAAKRGIKVILPMESDLAQPPALYGYSDSTPFGRKMHVREQELKDRVNTMKAEKAKLEHSITYLEGALEDLDYIKAIWSGVQT